MVIIGVHARTHVRTHTHTHTLVLTITGTDVLPPGIVCGGVQATLFSVILNTGHGSPPTVML